MNIGSVKFILNTAIIVMKRFAFIVGQNPKVKLTEPDVVPVLIS